MTKYIYIIMCMLCVPMSVNAAALNIVGSSTVYPFSYYVAHTLSEKAQISSPTFSITGSGKGIKLFCASDAPSSPDMINASRRMRSSELAICHKNGVDVSEMMIGYDGISLVQGRMGYTLHLTSQALFLALAKTVPSKDGRHLVVNPYHYWDDIDTSFPHHAIRIFGPPETAGTRDIIEHKLMDVVSRNMKAYQSVGNGSYHEIREDGVFISDGEDHEKIIPILQQDTSAIAMFGYSIYHEYYQKLTLLRLDGYELNPETVSSMTYPLSRPLFFYIKSSHMKKSKDFQRYVKSMMSEEMIGKQGECVNRGLIPLPGSVRNAYRMWLKYHFELSQKNLEINIHSM